MQLVHRKIDLGNGKEMSLQVDERAIYTIELLLARHSNVDFVSYHRLLRRLSQDFNVLNNPKSTTEEMQEAKAFGPTLMALYAMNASERAQKRVNILFTLEDEDQKAYVPSEFAAMMPLGWQKRDELRKLVMTMLQESGHMAVRPLEADGQANPAPESPSPSAGVEDSSTS